MYFLAWCYDYPLFHQIMNKLCESKGWAHFSHHCSPRTPQPRADTEKALAVLGIKCRPLLWPTQLWGSASALANIIKVLGNDSRKGVGAQTGKGRWKVSLPSRRASINKGLDLLIPLLGTY